MSASTNGPTASARPAARATAGPLPGRSLVAGLLLGIGTATTVDEVVFHQLLQWHHFYDRSTTQAGIVSDGILHAVGWAAAIGSLFLLADLQRRQAVRWPRWTGGLLLGAGGFQLYDGTVQHKLMGLHEIRYGVDLLVYDVAWNAVGAALLVAGLVLVLRSHAAEGRAARSAHAGRGAAGA